MRLSAISCYVGAVFCSIGAGMRDKWGRVQLVVGAADIFNRLFLELGLQGQLVVSLEVTLHPVTEEYVLIPKTVAPMFPDCVDVTVLTFIVRDDGGWGKTSCKISSL